MNLIFIPGLLCTEEVWGDLNSLRSISNYIDADTYSSNSIENFAENIIKKIDRRRKYILIGISMGGYVALELATRGYDWIQQLVLINTTACAVNKKTIIDRERAIAYAKSGDLNRILALAPGLCFYEKKKKFLQLEKVMAHKVGCQAYINQQTAIIYRKSYVQELDKILIPTLILSSYQDQVIPYQDSLILLNRIKDARLILFNKVGHLPTIERSTETAKVIQLFLEQNNESKLQLYI